jgi:ABC-2 type transport system ATP-binding protein
MISCQKLTRRFGDFTAVDDLTFDVERGEVCAFLGPNGAGKSTTVKMLTGLLAPTSGSATVAGLDIVRDAFELKRRIGVLPENLGLFDDLTVEEHLHLTGDIWGFSRADTRHRTDSLLATFGMNPGRDTFASRCSHGMRKKTALAMALLPNPEVLFLDEPFEALDPVSSRNLRDLLKAIAARGITIFLTSHILSLIEQIATRIMVIRGGAIVYSEFIAGLERPLEDLYFDLIEPPPVENLEWLGSSQS